MPDKLRRFVHILVAEVAYRTGLLRLWLSLRRRGAHGREVYVLGLHRVLSEEEVAHTGSLEGMVVKEGTFARMLAFLRPQFRVISIDEFMAGGTGSNQRVPACMLTFDDGWRDSYTRAYPLLKKFKIPATIFVTTGWIDGWDIPWVEKLGAAWKDAARSTRVQARAGKILAKPAERVCLDEVVEHLKHMSAVNRRELLADLLESVECGAASGGADQMLSWDEVIALSRDGVEIGSHAVSHPLLPQEAHGTVEQELLVSKQTLEEKLGQPARAFAYPNGDLNDRIRGMVKEAGYQCAFTTRRGVYRLGADLFTVRRFVIHEGNVTGWGGRFSPAMLSLTLARGRR